MLDLRTEKKGIVRLGIQKILVFQHLDNMIEQNKLQAGSELFIQGKSRTAMAPPALGKLHLQFDQTCAAQRKTKEEKSSLFFFLHFKLDPVKPRIHC